MNTENYRSLYSLVIVTHLDKNKINREFACQSRTITVLNVINIQYANFEEKVYNNGDSSVIFI